MITVCVHAAISTPLLGARNLIIVACLLIVVTGIARGLLNQRRRLLEDVAEAIAIPTVLLLSKGSIDNVVGVAFASLFTRPLRGPGAFRVLAPPLYCATIVFASIEQGRHAALGPTLGILFVGSLMNVLAFAVEEQARAAAEADATRKQLYLSELSRRDAQRLEALGRLAGGVAHDFNNVIACIACYTEFAAESLAPDHPAHEDLRHVRASTERARELTDSLLSVGRRAPAEAGPTDIAVVVSESVATLRRLMPKEIALTFDRDEAVPFIHAERSKVERLVTNLVLNARDACNQGGRIDVEVRGVTEGVHLVVRDDGRGMSDDVRRRVFEPFFTTKEGSGTGLGLANVDPNVHQLGGSITLESALGQGTTVRVVLPQRTRRALRRTSSRPELSRDGQRRILVVDDEEGVRNAAQRVLQRAGYAVDVAGSASEALAKMESAQRGFDIVLSDIIMPETTGIELGGRIASRWPGVTVLYMSGFVGDHDVAAVDVLPKPFTNGELTEFVSRCVGSVAA
jgi:signal transduction histidine kinase/CheY-like chemotaxis protein